MGGIGQQEMLLLMALALIFFGAKKLPEIARGIGKGMSNCLSIILICCQRIRTNGAGRMDPRRYWR